MGAYLRHTQCVACDRGQHSDCNGTVGIMDQDGLSYYVCGCHCRRPIIETQRIADAERRVKTLMRDLNIDNTHVLVRKDYDTQEAVIVKFEEAPDG